jgi:hypothetical protein
MRLRNLLLLSAMTLTTLASSTLPARASSFCDRIADPYQRFYCQGRESVARAQQARVRSYSDRQRYLAQTVSQIFYNYYQRTGQVLTVTDQTVVAVMQIIGASQPEAAFVVDRMVANANAIAAIQRFR